jgi:putative endonuclease
MALSDPERAQRVEGESNGPASFYILRLRSGALYPGSTTDLDRRWAEHLAGMGGQTTKVDPPVELAYSEEHATFSEARRREAQVKRWTRAKKEALVSGNKSMLHKLAKRHPHAISEIRFTDLSHHDTGDVFRLCSGCIYWELPELFDQRPPKDAMRQLKERWLLEHSTGRVLGKVARAGKDICGFIQYGAPEMYPRRLEYRSGPVSRDAMLITCLFVAEPFRKLGLARQLLSFAERAAIRDYASAALEAFVRKNSTDNPSGPLELYLACGFEILREDDEFPLVRKVLRQSQ